MSNVTKLVGISYVNGIIKSDGSNGFAGASAGTDYQAPIKLTTTGTSGVASFSSGTLNIPNYGDSIGAAGSAGTSGSSGTSGSAGSSGTSGSSGSTGTSGSSGSTGTSGSSGSTGTSGSSGSTGSSGSSGSTGTSGSAGSSGSTGSSGSSGSTGSSGTSGAGTISGTTNYVPKFTSGTVIGNSQIFDNGTNVGVGNASPGYKLDVGGIINSNSSGTGTLNLGFTAGSSQIAGRITGVQSPSYNATGKIGFSVTTWGAGTDYGLTEVMAIDMRNADNKNPVIWMNPFGGSVGIGTTSPGRQLELAGTADAYIQLTRNNTGVQATLGFNTGATNDWLIRTDDSSANLKFYSYGTSNYPLILSRSTGAATFISSITAGGDIVLSAANPFVYGGTAAGGAGISNIGGQTYIKVFGASHATLANVTQFVNASSTSLTIASSGAATFNSSVSASTYLGVSRNGSDTIGSGPYLVLSQTTNARQWIQQMSASLSLNYYHYNGSAWIQPLTLGPTGNIGIGTASPEEPLHVYTTTADDNGGFIRYENGNGGTGGATNAQIIGKSRYGTVQMLVWDSNGTRIGMRSVTNGGSGNIYFTTGNDNVAMQLIGNNLTVTGTITENSSVRYKENIETLKYGLDKIVQLRGVTYNKKDTGVKEIGLIAEEVESILPDVVLKNQEGEPDSVSYSRITAVLIEAIKELKMEIEELKRR